jgi:autotransporter-associated beta strand protein
MKNRFAPLCPIVASLYLVLPAHAASYFWDGTSTTADANGGNGTWDTTTTNWDTLASAGADIAWPSSGTDNDAVFGGTAGTVTVDAGGVIANDITFNTANYILQGGKISLNGTTPTISNAVAATINSEIAGTAGLVKSGAGTLTLGGANTYTGTTTMTGGTLTLSGGNNRLATTGTVSFAGSSTLDLGGNSQTLSNLSVTAGGTVNNTITNGSLTISGASDLLLTTPASPTTAGAYSLDASGLSSLTISKSANNFNVGGNGAATQAQSGTVKLSSASNTITVNNLNVGLNGGTGSIVNSGTLSLGTANAINATNVQVGGTRSNGNLSFQTGLTTPMVTFRGVTGGTTRVTKFTVGVNGAGGTAGNTQVADFSLGSIDLLVTNLIVAQGQSAATTGTPPSVNGTFTMGIGTVDATNIILSDNIAGGGNSTNTAIFNQNAGAVTVGTLTLGQRLGSTLTPILSANYNLGTSTTAGILKATTVQAGIGTVNASSVRNINFKNGTIQNFDSATDLTINGSGTAANSRINIILAATGSHTFNADIDRTITLGANTLVSGTDGTLIKAGAGTLVMNAANTYTGSTTIDGGTVSLVGGADRLPSVTNLTLANTAGVLLNLNGNNQTIGSLAGGGTSGGNISLGTGILKVGNANTTTFSGQLSGTGSLVKVGSGSLTLDGNSTVSLAGMNTSGGTLEITSGNYTITGSASTSAPDGTTGFVVSRGGTFRLNGGNITATSGTYLFTAGNTGGGGNSFILDSGTFNADGREILNAYGSSGTTTINGGLFVGNGFKVTQNVGILNLNGGTLRVNRLYGDGNTSTINFNGGTLQARQNNTGFVDGTITNALVKVGGAIIDSNSFNVAIPEALLEDAGSTGGGLTKQGNGTLTLSAANTYTGATKITGGTLALSGTGSIADSSAIIVGASTTFDVSGVTGGFTLGSAQTLSGTGSVAGAMTVAGTLSPGNSPGSLATASQTWLNGGDFNWQILDATGAAGTGSDTMVITGSLDLTSLTTGGFNINLWSLASTGPDVNGDALNFSSTTNYSWTLASTTTGITGFDATDFTLNVGASNGTSGFSNALDGGAFTISQSGNSLLLNYTAVPEPSVAVLGGMGLLALLRRRRR